ncbi:MAG: FtsQ-type POTRA domain-containing protein [Pseudomonadota bacterium]
MGAKTLRKNIYKKSIRRRATHLKDLCFSVFKLSVVLCLLVAMSFMFIFMYDFVTQAECFEAKAISVKGCNRIEPAELLKWAGVSVKTNILAVSINDIKDRLEAHPWVKSADVRREAPDKIHIQIVERVLIAVVDLGTRFLMDDEGVIFKRLEHDETIAVPIITGLQASDFKSGGKAQPGVLNSIFQIAKDSASEQSVLPLSSVTAIHLDKDTGLTLYAFSNDAMIDLGFEGYQEKLHRLKDVIDYITSTQGGMDSIEYINLRHTERVVVKTRAEEEQEADITCKNRKI